MHKTMALMLVVSSLLACAPRAQASSFFNYNYQAASLFSQAREAAKRGEYDEAFLSFRTILENHPDSRYYKRAQFAVGEYYFLTGNYQDAAPVFLQLIADDPKAKNTIFCLAYLLRIAQNTEDEELIAQFEHNIVTFHQLSLVFRESKQFTYRSSLLRRHKVIYYIDKVEFYVNGELFAQIAY